MDRRTFLKALGLVAAAPAAFSGMSARAENLPEVMAGSGGSTVPCEMIFAHISDVKTRIMEGWGVIFTDEGKPVTLIRDDLFLMKRAKGGTRREHLHYMHA